MILYLYALADGLDDVTGVTGVGDEPLVLAPVANILVVGGWLAKSPGVDRDSLIAQDRIVRELHARADALLPMRFGASQPNLHALARVIDGLGTRIHSRLDLVRGREQMTLRVFRKAGAAGAPSRPEGRSGEVSPELATDSERAPADASRVGTRYLESRVAAATPAELTPLTDLLRPLQRATRIEQGRHEGLLATLYQLIDRGSSETYRRAAEEATTELPTMSLRITGPAPAYAFADLAAPQAP